MRSTLDLYRRFHQQTGDPIAASNLTLAHAMLQGQEPAEAGDLTISEAAKRLRCSESKISRLIAAGELLVYRVGRAVRIRPEAIDQYIREQSSGDQMTDLEFFPASRRPSSGR
jgi:excisionase family DNA binding protein